MSVGINWETLGALIVFILSVAGLLKYVFYLLDKHKEAIDGRFKEHKERLSEHKTLIDDNAKQIQETKVEMHRDFVKHEQHKESLDTLSEISREIFARLNSMHRDLHQVIGAFNGKVKDSKDSDE